MCMCVFINVYVHTACFSSVYPTAWTNLGSRFRHVYVFTCVSGFTRCKLQGLQEWLKEVSV